MRTGEPVPLSEAQIIPTTGVCPQRVFGTEIAPSGYANYVQPVVTVSDARVGDVPDAKGEFFSCCIAIQGSSSIAQGGHVGIDFQADIREDLGADLLAGLATALDFANILIGSGLTSFATSHMNRAANSDRVEVITIIDHIEEIEFDSTLWQVNDQAEFDNPGNVNPFDNLPSTVQVQGKYGNGGPGIGARADISVGLTNGVGGAWPRHDPLDTSAVASAGGAQLLRGLTPGTSMMSRDKVFPFVLPPGMFLNIGTNPVPWGGNSAWTTGWINIAWREFSVN